MNVGILVLIMFVCTILGSTASRLPVSSRIPGKQTVKFITKIGFLHITNLNRIVYLSNNDVMVIFWLCLRLIKLSFKGSNCAFRSSKTNDFLVKKSLQQFHCSLWKKVKYRLVKPRMDYTPLGSLSRSFKKFTFSILLSFFFNAKKYITNYLTKTKGTMHEWEQKQF